MNANDTTPNEAEEAAQLSTHITTATPPLPISSLELHSPHSRSEELEEGQVRIHVQQLAQEPTANGMEDREESAGAIRVPACDDQSSSAEDESDEDDHEIDILLREEDHAAAAPHIIVAPAAPALSLPLLLVNRADENAAEAPQSLVSSYARSEMFTSRHTSGCLAFGCPLIFNFVCCAAGTVELAAAASHRTTSGTRS